MSTPMAIEKSKMNINARYGSSTQRSPGMHVVSDRAAQTLFHDEHPVASHMQQGNEKPQAASSRIVQFILVDAPA